MSEMPGFLNFLEHSDALARTVLAILLIASIVSWTLIVTRSIRLARTRRLSDRFLTMFWEAPGIEAVATGLRDSGAREPYAQVLQHGMTAVEHINRSAQASRLVDAGTPDAMLTRALRRSIDETRMDLEHGQSFLATVASTAPFVGLLGTVWGIYHALVAIGLTGQGTLDKVAGPVGEALIMTGIGLAVAIPAAVAYNAFARATRNSLARLNSFAFDVHTFLSTGIKAGPGRADARTTGDNLIQLVRNQAPTQGAVR